MIPSFPSRKLVADVATCCDDCRPVFSRRCPNPPLRRLFSQNGISCPQKATHEEIARLTVQAVKRSVPSAVPGVFFLSGEFSPSSDNEEFSTLNLNEMNANQNLPWHCSFSYGKALQKTVIVTWMGQDENRRKAQNALLNRARANGEATKGAYKKGSCASVGTDGNIKMPSDAY